MVKEKAGERTKRLIADTCKELFYRNGYSKTTYDMICREADVAPGAITYHFGSKAEIATHIANELSEKLEARICDFFPELEIGHWERTFLVVKARWYVVLRDPRLRRFYREINKLDSYTNPVIDILQLHRPYASRELSNEELMLVAATVVGQDGIILDLAEQKPEIFTYEKIAEYTVSTFFRLLDLDKALAAAAVEKGDRLFALVKDHLDYSFFEAFRYVD